MTIQQTPDLKPNKSRTKRWQIAKGYGVLTVLSLIWGMAFVAIRRADFELSPINLALLRWLLACAGFLTISPFILKPKTKFEGRDLPRLLVISLLNVPAYHLALNFGETTVSSGLAGLLVAMGPVLIAVLSAVLLKEKLGRRLVLALAIGIAGTLIMSLPDLNLNSVGSILGPLEVLVAAFSFATFSVLSKPLVTKYGSASVTIWAGLAGTVMLLPLLSPSFGAAIVSLSVEGWFSVLFLALLSTVAGYLMFYALISRSPVSRVGIQMYLIPVVSVIGGILLLQEGLNAYTIAGGAILLVSVALATKSRS
jgi:drug/metabolite transporter (DMT)-like permease